MAVIWNSKYVRILTIVLLVQAALFYTVSHGDSRPLHDPLKKFPATLPGWRLATEGVVDQETLDILRADDVLERFYVHSSVPLTSEMTADQKAAVMSTAQELFVAYFSTQQQGQSPHSPKNCLPGNGWQQVQAGEMEVPIAGLANPIKINRFVISKAENTSLVLYWYQSHGRVVANEFAAKFYLVADSLRYHRSDTALVRVVTPVIHDDLPTALNNATTFVQAVFPAVYHYLPM
ncbi:MAG TPA: EpsI family protein [Bryobacteraceae bacterium]